MYRPATDHPSFSSSLLDQIYRSIDEPDHQKPTVYRHDQFSKLSWFSTDARACLIEKWMDKEVKSVSDFNIRSHRRSVNSSSDSDSDSSSGVGFSSLEAESVYGESLRPKPIQTGIIRHDECITQKNRMNMYGKMYQFEDLNAKQKHEGKFMKTKSRAMKMYTDLKKMKQPISPGGRLATFLNSIFATANSKNTKLSSYSVASYDDRESNFAGGSTCSSASSFSRSCLSKTPSSRGKLGNSNKRSVRFVQNPSNDEVRANSSKKTCSIEEAPRNFSRNYQKMVESEFDLIKGRNETDLNYEDDDDDDDHDDDDDVSNSSSDLFELENFCAIGMESYGDELPVFETTHLNKRKA